MAWVGAAGPVTNFLLALVGRGLIWLTYSTRASTPRSSSGSSLLNVILGTLNLLPVPPLDGSRVVGGFLPRADVHALGRAGPVRQLRLHRALRRALHLPGGLRGYVRRRPGLRSCSCCRAGDSVTAPRGVEWRERDGLRWLQWAAGGATRRLPVAGGRSLAAALRQPQSRASVDDRREAVLENRRRRCAAAEVPRERLVVPGQVHGTAMSLGGRGRGGSRRRRQHVGHRRARRSAERRGGPRPRHQLRRLRADRHRRPTGRRGRRSPPCTPAGAA